MTRLEVIQQITYWFNSHSFYTQSIMKKKLVIFCLLLTSILIWSCKDDSEDPQPDPTPEADATYTELYNKFESGQLIQSFQAITGGKYQATFGDGSTMQFESKQFYISRCTPLTWPVVSLNNNQWSINGTSSGIQLNSTPRCIAALYYDTEGLYARASDGRILFFHHDEAREIGCYRLELANNAALSSSVIARVEGTTISATLPSGIPAERLVATVGYRGTSLKIDGMEQISSITPNNYSTSKTMKVTGFDGKQQEFEVQIAPFRNIPILRITTEGNTPVTSKDDYLNAQVTINDPDRRYSTEDLVNVATEIRGRGNSTWGMPKKPYKLKLNKKASLLGMSTDKEWALLANYSDKSLMRNYLIFELSRMLKLDWTPQTRPVELYLNNQYQGEYMLTEHVKVSGERVNITTAGTGDNTGDAVTGGYFLEIDERYDGVNFTTTRGLPIVFKEPKEPTNQQRDYLRNYFNKAEDALYGSTYTSSTTGYAAYIDVKSFVANYIIQELSKNIDGNMRLSNHLVKERNGKIKFSNVWDFDLTLGNANYFDGSIGNGPTGFCIKNSRWYNRLFQDPAFVAQVKTEWSRIYPQLYRLEVAAREYAAQIDQAQKRNFNQWRILGVWVWPNVVWPSTYKGEVDYLVNFLNDRASWMNQQISTW